MTSVVVTRCDAVFSFFFSFLVVACCDGVGNTHMLLVQHSTKKSCVQTVSKCMQVQV